MMGRKDDHQGHFFYHFKLDERIPQDHLLRGIDQFLDLGQLHEHLEPFYSHSGRPSIANRSRNVKNRPQSDESKLITESRHRSSDRSTICRNNVYSNQWHFEVQIVAQPTR